MRKTTLIPCILLLCVHLQGQENKDTIPLRFEVGLNVSNVLANFFNSDFPRSELEQYTLAFKRMTRKGGSAFRVHLGGDYSTNNESSQFGRFDRDINTQGFRSKVGWEWHKSITDKLQLIYGPDALFDISKTTSTTFSQNGKVSIEAQNLKVGGAAFLGFRYRVSDRFILTTESALNIFYQERESVVTENGTRTLVLDSEGYSLSHSLPVALYVYIKI